MVESRTIITRGNNCIFVLGCLLFLLLLPPAILDVSGTDFGGSIELLHVEH